MLNINNQVFVTLKIDGNPVEYAHILEITMCEGNGVYAPTLKMELADPTSQLSTAHALSEGNPIEIFVGRALNDSSAKARRYRVFGPVRDNNSWNPNLTVIGILDAPEYFVSSAREVTEGTSDAALRAIAGKAGLTFSGPTKGRSMNDKMRWWDVIGTRAKNAFDITRHGYMDDKSCMEVIVTSYHEMRYRNLIDEINTSAGEIKYLFTHSKLKEDAGGKKNFQVKEARDKSNAGLMTSWHNYGSTRCSNHIEGIQKNRKKVDVKTPGAWLPINQAVSDDVDRSRFDYATIDCTNTHKHYQDALYQNIKQLALFSETMSLLVLEVTDIQLFDPLIYRQADGDPTEKVRNEDIYILIGKTIVVRGGVHYAERLQCIRMSLTMEGKTDLETSLDEGEEGDSAIPESTIDWASAGSNGGGNGQSSQVFNIGNMSSGLTGLTGGLQGLTGNLSSIAGPAMGGLTSLTGLLTGGANPSTLISSIGSLLGPVSGMLGQVTTLQGQTNNMPGMLTGLIGSLGGLQGNTVPNLNTIPGYPPPYGTPQIPGLGGANSLAGIANIASSVFSQDGNIMSSLAETVKLIAAYSGMGQATNNVMGQMPYSVQQSQNGQDMMGLLNPMMGQLQTSSGTSASTWNTLLSMLTGQRPPVYGQPGYQATYPYQQPTYPGYPPQYPPQYPAFPTSAYDPTNTQNPYQSGFLVRLLLLMMRPGFSQETMMAFMAQESARQVGGQPNWLGSGDLMQNPLGIQNPSVLGSMIDNIMI